MNETLAVFKIAWAQMLVYRLNFVLWRVRTVLMFLLVYFIWWTVFQDSNEVFGYTQASILTYIVMIAVIRAITLSSRATDVMNKINDGSFTNFLVKPLNVIKFYFSQDIADKLLNIIFMVFEISLILILLRPELIIQTNSIYIFLFAVSLILAILLWFFVNMIISLMAFWVENSWGPLFLMMIFVEGLGGGLFPIDILPKEVFNFLMITPFPYLIYFPAKVYLNSFSTQEMILYFSIFIFWVITGWVLMNRTLKKGLKHYTAGGH